MIVYSKNWEEREIDERNLDRKMFTNFEPGEVADEINGGGKKIRINNMKGIE